MKCPKCGYLGFETTERCRHCGYDFSLSLPIDSPSELPLRAAVQPEGALSDFDLDRIIGGPDPAAEPLTFELATPRSRVAVAVETPPADELEAQYFANRPAEVARTPAESAPAPEGESEAAPTGLPLFGRSAPEVVDDQPMTPPPARTPLAVRRATPEVARRRTPRTIRRDADGLAFDLEPAASTPDAATSDDARASETARQVASASRRLGAAVVDALLLGFIDVGVLYLTLALTGLGLWDVLIIPPIPMLSFFLLLNGGYLIAFTAASGQTIGKMLTGIRVIGDDGDRVDIAGAVLRAAGVLLSIVLIGLPYLPALVSRDKRALHDRLAGTRVVLHA